MLTSPLYFQVKSSSVSAFRLPIVASLTWKTRLATTMTKMETSVILLGLKLDPAPLPLLLPPLRCRFELSLQPFSSSQLWGSQATGYQFRIIKPFYGRSGKPRNRQKEIRNEMSFFRSSVFWTWYYEISSFFIWTISIKGATYNSKYNFDAYFFDGTLHYRQWRTGKFC